MAILILALSFAAYVVAQFVTAPTDLITKVGAANITVRYKEVPAGICEQDPSIKSYSGYADVAEHQHIFWWFFEARNDDPSEAPLTVWINGGPGSSSMIGKLRRKTYVVFNWRVNNVQDYFKKTVLVSWTQIINHITIPIPGAVSQTCSTSTSPLKLAIPTQYPSQATLMRMATSSSLTTTAVRQILLPAALTLILISL
jgi:hypothetical protein